jgi:FG-GAP-like repeat
MKRRKRLLWSLGLGGLSVVLLLSLVVRWLRPHPPMVPTVHDSAPSQPSTLYGQAVFLGEGAEWRPYPLLVDLNGDGHLDLVATHRVPLEANALHIWLGTGQGTFSEVPQTWRSPGYAGLAAGDLNKDGQLDLLAASHFHQLVTFLGDGTGRWTVSGHETSDGYAVARLVDVAGDGHLDAILLGAEEAGIEIYRGDGTGTWTLLTQLMPGPIIGRDLAVGDINGDGKLDLIAVFEHGVVIVLQDGSGGWVRSPTDGYAIPGEFFSVAVGDVNHDGHLDIALNGNFLGLHTPHGPDVYLGHGHGGWTSATNGLKVLQFAAPGVALGDVDQDGCLDLLAGGNSTEAIGDTVYGLFLFTGDCRGNWTLHPQSGLPATGLMLPYGIALGDLNHDGRMDMVVAHGATASAGGSLTIWLHR